jgi:hypothetical protein
MPAAAAEAMAYSATAKSAMTLRVRAACKHHGHKHDK